MNPKSPHLPDSHMPQIPSNACIHSHAIVIGNVIIGESVMVAPFASIRADEGAPFYIGDRSNVQDGVEIHALEVCGDHYDGNTMVVGDSHYAVYIGSDVSLAHQSQDHGPAVVHDNCFIGMQCLVFRSQVNSGCVLEPGAKAIGVTIPKGRYIPAGQVITMQDHADALPVIDESYALRKLNQGVVTVNCALANAYQDV